MKLAFRVTIICVYLLLPITSTFGDFAFLTAFSYLERPAPENWNFPNLPPPTRLPRLRPQVPKMIIPGVGPTLTGAKAQSVLRHPPHPALLLQSSRVHLYHHLIRTVSIHTHSPLWRLWHREVRPGHPLCHLGTLKTRLEQKAHTILALPRTAGLSRASESHYKLYPGGYWILSLC